MEVTVVRSDYVRSTFRKVTKVNYPENGSLFIAYEWNGRTCTACFASGVWSEVYIKDEQ